MINIELVEATVIELVEATVITKALAEVLNNRSENSASYALTFISQGHIVEVMAVTILKDQSLVMAINQCYAKFAEMNVHDVRLTDIKKL